MITKGLIDVLKSLEKLADETKAKGEGTLTWLVRSADENEPAPYFANVRLCAPDGTVTRNKFYDSTPAHALRQGLDAHLSDRPTEIGRHVKNVDIIGGPRESLN